MPPYMRRETRLSTESVNLNRAFHKRVAALPITQICDDLLNLSPLFGGGEVEAVALAKASGEGRGSAVNTIDGLSGRACCVADFPTR
jgi:hypothetical protein